MLIKQINYVLIIRFGCYRKTLNNSALNQTCGRTFKYKVAQWEKNPEFDSLKTPKAQSTDLQERCGFPQIKLLTRPPVRQSLQ